MRPHPAAGSVPVSGCEKADGYILRPYDPDFSASAPAPFIGPEGVVFRPAYNQLVASQDGMVLVMLDDEDVGLFAKLTPESVRILAHDMIRVADKVEAESALRSNAQLARVLSQRPPA